MHIYIIIKHQHLPTYVRSCWVKIRRTELQVTTPTLSMWENGISYIIIIIRNIWRSSCKLIIHLCKPQERCRVFCLLAVFTATSPYIPYNYHDIGNSIFLHPGSLQVQRDLIVHKYLSSQDLLHIALFVFLSNVTPKFSDGMI